jgi:dimethylargininase
LSHALVRSPGTSFVRAISSQQASIDVKLAQAQHAEYCQALTAAGLTVKVLPLEERYPDSCFVQDPAMVIRGQAIICRPGAPSRQGEEVSVAEALASRFPLARIVEPGTLEGGDVLCLPSRVLVGHSGRSNKAGIAQLAQILTSAGLPVEGVPVGGYLHLLSAVTYVGHSTLLAVEAFADHPAYAGMDVIVVPPEESYAVNALGLGSYVILPAGHERVASLLRARGFVPLPVSMSEFAKADGGVTCLSLVWDG